MNYITTWDLEILHKINTFATPELNLFFKYITNLAGYKFIMLLIIVLLAYNRTRKIGLQVLIAELSQLLIGSFFLKNLIARPRPFLVDPSIELIVKAPKTFSFPSGHTSTAFALAFALIYADCPKFWKLIGLAFAVIIGFSRLYLQVHFPTDVLFGMVLGFACGYFSKIINRFL